MLITTRSSGDSFIQFAEGQFTTPVSGPNHCGPDRSSPKTFAFEVQIEYRNPTLTEQGFLIDNLAFDQYFDGIGTVTESCEELARKAAIDFLRMAIGLCPDCEVRVSIWGIPGKAMVQYLAKPVFGGAK